jgi:hypothetical protein
MDLFDDYGFDDTLETQGVWKPLKDSAFLLARFGNERHQQLMVELRTQYKEELAAQTPEGKKLQRDLLIKTLVDSILLNWKNVSYGGQPLEYSKEAATKVLQHRQFREWVIGTSMDEDSYRAALLEDDVKNSELPSSGSSPGDAPTNSSETSTKTPE